MVFNMVVSLEKNHESLESLDQFEHDTSKMDVCGMAYA